MKVWIQLEQKFSLISLLNLNRNFALFLDWIMFDTNLCSLGITLTASISPEAATPNLLVYWLPPPESGQWTDTAIYRWNRQGEKTVQVSAIQAGITVTDTHTISLEAGILKIFFPVINH